jgi:hypothetical protein
MALYNDLLDNLNKYDINHRNQIFATDPAEVKLYDAKM